MRILAFVGAAPNSWVRATESRPTRYPSMKLQISVLLD
jgi:hypothetical protein